MRHKPQHSPGQCLHWLEGEGKQYVIIILIPVYYKPAIEVDKSIHLKEDVKARDIIRLRLLEGDGLQVWRFTNGELEQHLE